MGLYSEKGHSVQAEAEALRIQTHLSMTLTITSVFGDSIISTFHLMPFHQKWEICEGCTVRVYSEAYSSPAFLDAYKDINALPQDPDDNLE
jgi:hypothetical protein